MKQYVAPKVSSERLELGVFGCYSGPVKPRFHPLPQRGRGRGRR